MLLWMCGQICKCFYLYNLLSSILRAGNVNLSSLASQAGLSTVSFYRWPSSHWHGRDLIVCVAICKCISFISNTANMPLVGGNTDLTRLLLFNGFQLNFTFSNLNTANLNVCGVGGFLLFIYKHGYNPDIYIKMYAFLTVNLSTNLDILIFKIWLHTHGFEYIYITLLTQWQIVLSQYYLQTVYHIAEICSS